jgi:predicted PurR-regulated permease PerM
VKFSGRTLLPLGFAAAAIFLVIQVRGVLLPFIMAAALAYLLNPLVNWFEIRGMRRPPVVGLVFLVLLTTATLGSYVVASVMAQEAQKATRQMPVYVQRAETLLAQLRRAAVSPQAAQTAPLHQFPMLQRLIANRPLLDYVSEKGRTWPNQIVDKMAFLASGILPLLEMAFLVPFVAFFLMLESHRLRDGLLGLVPPRYVEMTLNLLIEMDNALGNYLRGIFLEALCVACMAFVGFWIIDLDYALQIATVVGLANIIPYVGPVVGAILGTGVALFEWGSVIGVIKVLAVCASVRFIEDWFIQPIVLRHAVRLHPVMIVFALMAGAELYGFVGLLFAIPAACLLKTLVQVLWQWYRSEYGYRPSVRLPEATRIPLI